MMKSKKLILTLVVGVVSCIAAILLTNKHIQDRIVEVESSYKTDYEQIDVVVATVNLNVGDEINATNVAVRKIPSTFLNVDAVQPKNVDLIMAKKTKFPIASGTPILTSHVQLEVNSRFSDLIRTGLRAVTVPVDELSSNSGFLSPGDRVDIYSTYSDGFDQYTKALLENVRVLATGRDADDGLDTFESYSEVTVALPPKLAMTLLHASDISEIRMVLRNKDDESFFPELNISNSAITNNAAIKLEHVTPSTVEFIVGGRQTQ